MCPMTRRDSPLKTIFDRVPRRYDLVNRVVTLGLDSRWRERAVTACLADSPRWILDICTGTGDLAIALARRTAGTAAIAAADFSAPMLAVAGRKAVEAGVAGYIDLLLGNAAQLPFADGALDAVTVGFGFRNLTYRNPARDHHLREIARILKPGGRFVIVESSQPRSAVLRQGYRLFLRAWVAPLGRLISGQRGAYDYLARSAAGFYRPEEVEQLLRDAGFSSVETTPLLGGAAAIHVALR